MVEQVFDICPEHQSVFEHSFLRAAVRKQFSATLRYEPILKNDYTSIFSLCHQVRTLF